VIAADLTNQANGYATITQGQKQRQNGSNQKKVASDPGMRVFRRECQCSEGRCQSETDQTKARPNTQPHQLPFSAVFLNRHFQTRGSKQAAADFEIPMVKAATAVDYGTSCF
jgi:hypothetical protein